MIRQQLRSTLFPYTTLFRSATVIFRVLSHLQPFHGASGRCEAIGLQAHALEHGNEKIGQWIIVLHIEGNMLRSEEHTSELQSLRHLVCRLLLEKKKNQLPTL